MYIETSQGTALHIGIHSSCFCYLFHLNIIKEKAKQENNSKRDIFSMVIGMRSTNWSYYKGKKWKQDMIR